MGAFLLYAIPFTWLAAVDPDWARPYRVQDKPIDVNKWLWPSVWMWLRNNAILTTLVVLAWPLLRHTAVHVGELPPLWSMLAQVVLFTFVDDFLYYWMHRTLHHKQLFQRIHIVHHKVRRPAAIAAHYMHPVEFVLTGALMLSLPVLMGAHLATIYLWICWRQWEAAEGHCGYSFPWSPSKLIYGLVYDGVEYHDFHHSRVKGNYAGFMSYLDGPLGTYCKGYPERIAARDAARKQAQAG